VTLFPFETRSHPVIEVVANIALESAQLNTSIKTSAPANTVATSILEQNDAELFEKK
jgi:hypothetical protein